VKRDLGVDVGDMAGAGAAGGFGAGLIAFLGARLQSGAVVVGEAAGIEERIRAADLVFTGEGRLDGQTAYGKTPQYIAKLAQDAGKPVVCIAGALGEGYETSAGLFTTVESLSDGKGPLPDRAEAARQVGEASKRAVMSLVDMGLILPGA
jgi:glycerate kinase